MKRVISIIIFFFFSECFPQAPHDYYFTGLRGLEDKNGKTHLFYTIYNAYKNPNYYVEDNTSVTIYHYDLSDSLTTVFLTAGYTYTITSRLGRAIMDFEFWDNDPSKYIYGGDNGGMDPNPFIVRYDNSNIRAKGFSGITNIEISKQNDSLLYSSSSNTLFKSTDYGTNWTMLANNFRLVSLSPFNDSLIFGESDRGYIVRSSDGGKTSVVVDSVRFNYDDNYTLYFDKDSTHIYRAVGKNLYVSSKSGSPNSFIHVFSGRKKLYLAPDYKRSGRIYIADGRSVFISEDYGSDVRFYKNVDRNIIALYSKPGTDIIYAATRYNIYEITPDTVIAIKSMSVPPDILNYYPLAKGNKWIYSYTVGPMIPPEYVSKMTSEVAGDTLMPNGKKYFFIKQYGPYPSKTYTRFYERIDSVTGRVYRYLYLEPDPTEVLIDDLAAAAGDTVLSCRFSYKYPLRTIIKNEDTVLKWNKSFSRKQLENSSLAGSWHYDLLQGIGLSDMIVWYDFGCDTYELKGCIIDGIVYGDTNYTVGVKEKLPVAHKFQLYQNYPNPFNPTTLIKYELPNPSFVSLKVYDALGNEIAVLVEEEQPAGLYEVGFPKQGAQLHLPSGIYFYTIKTVGHTETRKMLLIK